MKNDNIFIFTEQDDGRLSTVTKEVLSAGRKLADKRNGELTAVLLGHCVAGLTSEIAKHGADKILLVDTPALERYNTLTYCQVLTHLLKKFTPAVMLLGSTPTAHDLAPRLAARIMAGLTTGCVVVEINENGKLEIKKPAYGGNVYVTVGLSSERLQLITISPGAIEISSCPRELHVVLIEDAEISESVVQHIGIVKADPETIDISEAKIVIAGGRGLGQDGFCLLRKIAKRIGASIGGTRVAVDNGWIPYEKQIGQTGKNISPSFFISLGTSGALQYTMGFKESKLILAIDKNPKANIFEVADIGVIADLNILIPTLFETLNEYEPVVKGGT